MQRTSTLTLILSLGIIGCAGVEDNGRQNLPLHWTHHLELKRLEDIDDLLNRPLVTVNGPEELVLTEFRAEGDKIVKGKQVKVHSIKEYWKHRSRPGFEPDNNHQVAVESWFKLVGGALRFLKEARPARVSYVKDFRLTNRPSELPIMLGPYSYANDEFERIKRMEDEGKTWSEVYPCAEYEEHDLHHITFVDNNERTDIMLMAWGDINNDGFEDILLSEARTNVVGTYRSYRNVVVTRTQEDGRMEILNPYYDFP